MIRKMLALLQRRGPARPPVANSAAGPDWPAVRASLGMRESETLYYGFLTRYPGLHVPGEHFTRRIPGTPVFADGKPLKRSYWIYPGGEIVNREEQAGAALDIGRSIAHSASKDDSQVLGKNPEAEADMIAGFVMLGSSVYDRHDGQRGDAELALNILADHYDAGAAFAWYQAFAQEVVSELPLAFLDYRPMYEQGAAEKHAEWFIPSGDINSWLSSKLDEPDLH